MRDNKHFGSHRVATIFDCAGTAAEMAATAAAVSSALAQDGADLVISNHTAWQKAFRQAGFLSGLSNYLVGISKGDCGRDHK